MSRYGYPIWWDTTITIYNKYTNAQSVVSWYKTVVTDCFWKLSGSEVRVGDTVLDARASLCRIPKDTRFIEKQDWISLADEEKANHFTLAQGDIVVKGECDFVIDEYTKGHRSTDLLGKYREYQACFEITDYVNDTGLGRTTEHYLIRGK